MCLNLNVSAIYQDDSVYVPTVKQAKSNWCWAACAEMAGKNVTPSSTRTQYDVVTYIKGEGYPNSFGSLSDCASGARYVSLNAKTYYTTGVMSYNSINSMVRNGYAMIIVCRNSNGAHALLVYGTILSDTSGGTKTYLNFVDPWYGGRYQIEYQDIISTGYQGKVYDSTAYPS